MKKKTSWDRETMFSQLAKRSVSQRLRVLERTGNIFADFRGKQSGERIASKILSNRFYQEPILILLCKTILPIPKCQPFSYEIRKAEFDVPFSFSVFLSKVGKRNSIFYFRL